MQYITLESKESEDCVLSTTGNK